MNNKTLIIAIAILVLAGGALLVGGQFFGKNKEIQKQADTGGVVVTDEKNTTVTLSSSGFNPKTVNIEAKTRVIWLNKSGKEGSVNSADHPTHQTYIPLNLGGFPDGSSVQLVFDKPGTYLYHNHLNPSQTGTVVVK